MPVLRLALAQVNAVVGDLAHNVAALERYRIQASHVGVDLVVAPELAVTGYPPEDLLLKEGFVDAAGVALEELAESTDLPALFVGTVVPEGKYGVLLAPASDGRDALRLTKERPRPRIANALAVVHDGAVIGVATKRLLPNYDVFDERRYFQPGTGPGTVVNVNGVAVGLLVCEDVWVEAGPATDLVRAGASLLVVANASPYARGRQPEREAMLAERARALGCAIAYVNLVGGQDELVFDGQSVVVDATGEILARAGAFREELLVVDVPLPASTQGLVVEVSYSRDGAKVRATGLNRKAAILGEHEEIYQALVTGTRDYLMKNGFRSALVGLSGGIDSSLVAAIAVDAVGARAVRGFAMPSRYSSAHSLDDARELARRLDINLSEVPIEPIHHAASQTLVESLSGEPRGLTDENLQSRIRGLLLMAVSNDTGSIVLTTGNKSEMATGYSTLYGDSAGGFAVIKDVSKTLVYELCRYRNEWAVADGDEPPIPERVLLKAPSAELRPDQTDDQSLPPYNLLDPLLELYVEGDATTEELIAAGHPIDLVVAIAGLVDRSEYKRRQMPPGVRISRKAFGRDRRMPITNGFAPEKE